LNRSHSLSTSYWASRNKAIAFVQTDPITEEKPTVSKEIELLEDTIKKLREENDQHLTKLKSLKKSQQSLA
jgi:Skp family chaperone for outer membrane proteins